MAAGTAGRVDRALEGRLHAPPAVLVGGARLDRSTCSGRIAQWGADLVLAGHDHIYERIDDDGLPYVVNGLGGNERYTPGARLPDSVALYNASAGAGLVEADPTSMRLSFYDVTGRLIDRITLPNPGPTPRASATNDAVNCLYTLIGGRSRYIYRRVYIDTDVSKATGYPAGGVGADFMVENSGLYRHAGGGWRWSFVASAGQVASGDRVSWKVARAAIGQTASPNSDALAFEVETPGASLQNLGRLEHVYGAGTGGSGGGAAGASGGGAPITAFSADNDAASIRYRATFAAPYTYKHVFIDTDTNATSGYRHGGIGADYLVENNSVYRHTAAGWNWVRVGASAATGDATGPKLWTVPRALLGETAGTGEVADLVFHGTGGGTPEHSTPVIRHVYSPSAGR